MDIWHIIKISRRGLHYGITQVVLAPTPFPTILVETDGNENGIMRCMVGRPVGEIFYESADSKGGVVNYWYFKYEESEYDLLFLI